MGTVYPRGRRLWIGFIDPRIGRQRCVSSGLVLGQEAQARQLVAKVELLLKLGGAPPIAEPTVTVTWYAQAWIKRRKERGVGDASNEEARLRLHVLPRIGSMPMRLVKPRHLTEVVDALRSQGALAPRTILGVYGTVRMMFKSAVIDEVVDFTPAVLGRGQLPPNRDKDPSWRSRAVFTREELRTLVASPEVPLDRRMLYGLQGLAGLRVGEAVALRWFDYDLTPKPLGRIVVARSHGNPTTKTGLGRDVPVHPVLERLLSDWRLLGWPLMLGRAPVEDDLIIPSRQGRMRSRYHARNKLLEDLSRLGLRRRRGHDLRRTFITIAREDGARPDILEHVTHKPHGMVNAYSSLPWRVLCEEVGKLELDERGRL